MINNVPTGSYVIEIVNPTYAYEPVRVEINSKGKLRARKVNFIQTSTVDPVAYPLALTPLARYRYFQVREQWRATDFLYSPMVRTCGPCIILSRLSSSFSTIKVVISNTFIT